jgi:hypothetical protein
LVEIKNEFLPQPNKPPKGPLCMVITSEQHILTRARAVYETWGQHFNDLLFACNCPHVIAVKNLIEQNKEIPDALEKYIPVAHLPILNLNIIESIDRMGEKVLNVLVKSYEIYKNHSNFYYMVDDDAYVFVDNLYKYIESLDTSQPQIYGFKFHHLPLPGGHIFGGSGILFTNESMKRLVSKIQKMECEIHKDKFGDVTIGGCAFDAGIDIVNSIDEKGKPRFLPYDPVTHIKGRISKVFSIFGSYNKQIGKECCSDGTIAFHYVKSELMHVIYNNTSFLKDLLS